MEQFIIWQIKYFKEVKCAGEIRAEIENKLKERLKINKLIKLIVSRLLSYFPGLSKTQNPKLFIL